MSLVYTPFQMETALCIWEEMLEIRQKQKTLSVVEKDIHNLFESSGTGQARLCAVSLSIYADTGWGYVHESVKDMVVHDWEFIPWFIRTCVIWNTSASYIYANASNMMKPDWPMLCRNLGRTVVGYQFWDEDKDEYYGDHHSFDVFDEKTIKEMSLEIFKRGEQDRWKLMVIRDGDIEEPNLIRQETLNACG